MISLPQYEKKTPLIVHTDKSRDWGGQEIRTLAELNIMRQLGFATALMVPEDSELARRGRAEGFFVYPVSFQSKLHPSCWRETLRIIRMLQPTVLNSHSSEDSWIAGSLARLLRVPLVIRTRHVSTPVSSTLTYNLFSKAVFACSGQIADQLVAQKVPKEKIVVIPTGNDEERFRFSAQDRQDIRAAYGIAPDEILVGNVAFLRHYKGHPFLLRTAAQMPPHFRFMLVGDGFERLNLERLARELGIGDRVIFTGHQEEPERFLSAMDLCFFSSFAAEGVPQGLVQALLNGLPVLAVRLPSMLEVVEQVPAHRLVDYDDVATARQSLLELAALPARDPLRMEQQWQIIAERYGLRAMARTLLDAYAKFGIFPPERQE